MGDYGMLGTNASMYGSTGLSHAREACQTLTAQVIGYSRSMMDNTPAIQFAGPPGQAGFVQDKAYAGTIALYNEDFASQHQALRQNGSVTVIPPNCNAFVETNKPLREIQDKTTAIGIVVEDSTAETPMTTVAVAGVVDVFNNSGETIKQLDDIYWELPLPAMNPNDFVPDSVGTSAFAHVYPLNRARTRLPAGVAFARVKRFRRGDGGITDFMRVADQLGNPVDADIRHLGEALDCLDDVCGRPLKSTRGALSAAKASRTDPAKYRRAMEHMLKAFDASRRSYLGTALTEAKNGHPFRLAINRGGCK